MNEFEKEFRHGSIPTEFQGPSTSYSHGRGLYAIAWAIFAGLKLVALAIAAQGKIKGDEA